MDYRGRLLCVSSKWVISGGMSQEGGGRGGEMGESYSVYYIWHYYCLQTLSIVPLPLCQRQKQQITVFTFVFRYIWSPTKVSITPAGGKWLFSKGTISAGLPPLSFVQLIGGFRKTRRCVLWGICLLIGPVAFVTWWYNKIFSYDSLMNGYSTHESALYIFSRERVC